MNTLTLLNKAQEIINDVNVDLKTRTDIHVAAKAVIDASAVDREMKVDALSTMLDMPLKTNTYVIHRTLSLLSIHHAIMICMLVVTGYIMYNMNITTTRAGYQNAIFDTSNSAGHYAVSVNEAMRVQKYKTQLSLRDVTLGYDRYKSVKDIKGSTDTKVTEYNKAITKYNDAANTILLDLIDSRS